MYDLFYRCSTENREPELWELYEVYYDELYQRTKNPDGSYKNNERILGRDINGNLVNKYQADGTPLAEPNIIYHQAEFQVLEYVFTELLKREFEEQRGLIY
ncbi:MAG: hypothetical protein K2W94_07115 [Alphaproteobacteria bacterium]|nr:hypothetical protein [Alphaproteobacteria bacterium]